MARILLEGMDMSGKDATADQIIARAPSNWAKRNSVLAPCNPHYLNAKELSSKGAPEELIASALLESIRYDFKRCMKGNCCGQQSENVFQVSLTAFRSFAHHYPDRPEYAERFLGCLMTHSQHLSEFDKVVMLTATLESRRLRLAKQGDMATKHDRELLGDSQRVIETDRAIELVLTRCIGSGNFLKIDTSKMSIEQVANVVIYYCGLNKNDWRN